jgi:hypothetical protein
MRDVLRERMFSADATGVEGLGLTSLGHGVITGVEVFALFEVFGEVIGFGGDFTIEAEESLLIWGERSDINFVLLVGVHLVLEIVMVLWV